MQVNTNANIPVYLQRKWPKECSECSFLPTFFASSPSTCFDARPLYLNHRQHSVQESFFNKRISQLTKTIVYIYILHMITKGITNVDKLLEFVEAAEISCITTHLCNIHPKQCFQVFKSWLSGHSWEVLALLDEAWLVPQRKNKYSCIGIGLSTALLYIPTLFSKSDHCFPQVMASHTPKEDLEQPWCKLPLPRAAKWGSNPFAKMAADQCKVNHNSLTCTENRSVKLWFLLQSRFSCPPCPPPVQTYENSLGAWQSWTSQPS